VIRFRGFGPQKKEGRNSADEEATYRNANGNSRNSA
jgi:hypothetical protein